MTGAVPARRFVAAFALLAALAGGPPAGSQPAARPDALPLPRFVSLRSEEVNLRAGPGVRYPVEWVFRRRTLPVEVLAEFEQWRKIRDSGGTEGWVHQSMLSGRRYALVAGEVRTLRRQPEQGAAAVARLEPGFVGQLLECRAEWCRLDAGGFRGWLGRAEIWGVYPGEAVR
jgi:SH3-like domain-containing protein